MGRLVCRAIVGLLDTTWSSFWGPRALAPQRDAVWRAGGAGSAADLAASEAHDFLAGGAAAGEGFFDMEAVRDK